VDSSLVIFLSVAALGLARVLYAEFASRDDDRLTHTLARRPRARIQAIEGDVVRVTGHVRSRGELLQAPVTGRPCVAFHLLIEEWRYRNRCASWEVLLEIQQARPFAVTDESGEATVDTAGPTEVFLVLDRCGPSRRRDQADRAQLAVLKKLLKSGGVAITNWFGDSKIIRYQEGVLEEGEKVSVGGRAIREVSPDGERSSPRQPPERLVLRGTAEEPLLISDSPAAHGAPEP
jgi:hypothetical protein